jgi:hypothetical protein
VTNNETAGGPTDYPPAWGYLPAPPDPEPQRQVDPAALTSGMGYTSAGPDPLTDPTAYPNNWRVR